MLMKKYYTYFTIVHHPTIGNLIYVGKSTSKDPNYHGSCKYRYWNKWLKEHPEWFQTRILQYFDNSSDQGDAESALILACLHKYGSFLRGGFTKDGIAMTWLDQFKQGVCLNAHWQDGQQMRTTASYVKSIATRRSHGYKSDMKQCHTLEAERRRVEVRRANNSYSDCSNLHTAEIYTKIVATRHTNGSYEHAADCLHNQDVYHSISKSLRARSPKYILEDGFIGCCTEIAEHLGSSQGYMKGIVRRARELGSYTFYKGKHTIKPYVEDDK